MATREIGVSGRIAERTTRTKLPTGSYVIILPEMCLDARKNRLNFGSRTLLDHEDPKTGK